MAKQFGLSKKVKEPSIGSGKMGCETDSWVTYWLDWCMKGVFKTSHVDVNPSPFKQKQTLVVLNKHYDNQ